MYGVLSSEVCVTDPDITISADEVAASRELAVSIADIIVETPAFDTRLIDVHELTTISDFFVICSAENERQLRAIVRALVSELSKDNVRARNTEGDVASGWILMDYGDVVVHIFDSELRSFYQIEELWAEAPVLLAIQ